MLTQRMYDHNYSTVYVLYLIILKI